MNPDLLTTLADAQILRGVVLAAAEFGPEGTVVGGLANRGRHEHAVVLAFDLVQRVAERIEEVGVRREDGAIETELDRRL